MFFTVSIVSFLLILLIFITGKYNDNYWKRRGVIFYEGTKVRTLLWDFFTENKPLFIHLHKIYKKYPKEPAIGIGLFFIPSLYVKDPTNIQCVLSSDFNSFCHRGIETIETDILANSILFQNGNKWKLIRQSMTPLFTSSKLKSMFYIMDKSAQDFVHYMKERTEIRKGNTYNTLSTYCSAAICATVFGVTTESIFESPFLKVAQESFRPTFKINMRFAVSSLSKTLFKLFNVHFFKEFEDFFIGAIKQVVRQREKDNVKKHDFADLCVALQKKGKLKDPDTGFELEPTDELLAAQAFFFFIAGVEPTATTMFATLLELGKNSEIQKRVHDEIDKVFDKHNGILTYDIIEEMVYLDMVINEAMRLHPSIANLSRKCVQDTVLPVGNVKVEKGTKIFIPVYEIQHDPKFFPDPETFKAERFSKENRHKISDFTYMPFGNGGRTCIGTRYAYMQAKTGLVHILRHFNVKTNDKGKLMYLKHLIQVRLDHLHVEFLSR